MGINRDSHAPLYIQLRNKLKSKIEQGHYNVGDLIPSEKVLMSRYEVGRATVREAMKLLAAEGYLDKRQGIGTFVTKPHKGEVFGPLISLAYALDNADLHLKNTVLSESLVTLSEEEQKLVKFASTSAQKISRLRSKEGEPLLVEYFTHHEDFVERTKGKDYETSISQMLVVHLDLNIKKLYQETEIVEADEELTMLLNLRDDRRLLRHKRWMMVDGFEGCYQYYELLVPVVYSGYPFQNHF